MQACQINSIKQHQFRFRQRRILFSLSISTCLVNNYFFFLGCTPIKTTGRFVLVNNTLLRFSVFFSVFILLNFFVVFKLEPSLVHCKCLEWRSLLIKRSPLGQRLTHTLQKFPVYLMSFPRKLLHWKGFYSKLFSQKCFYQMQLFLK